ncbi:hypothetical protein HUJ05_001459 [Dendroctonus ponderosae]|nr:hypothetical protein HUJ05_001459 [Dendroctonus ponderosae]
MAIIALDINLMIRSQVNKTNTQVRPRSICAELHVKRQRIAEENAYGIEKEQDSPPRELKNLSYYVAEQTSLCLMN